MRPIYICCRTTFLFLLFPSDRLRLLGSGDHPDLSVG